MPVLEDGRLVGMVYREDILRWLELYGRQQLSAQGLRPGGSA